MTWWYLENLIDASTLSAPCKHVLQTLGRQINPPPEWDAQDPEAWDPASHPEALTVRYDRARLSLLTSYSPNTLRLLMKELAATKDAEGHPLDPVLYLARPARQHYVATYGLDLDALRRHRNPELDALDAQRKAAREARRRGHLGAITQRAQDVPPDVAARPDDAAIQRAHDMPPGIQGAQDTSSDASRGLKIRPPFSSSRSPDRSLSPFLGDPNPAPPAPKKNGRAREQLPPKTKTPPPQGDARRQLIADLTVWAEDHAPGVNAPHILDLWLFDCAAKHYAFPDWLGEGKTWLRKAYYEAREKAEQQQAAAARREAWRAQWQAAPAHPHPDDPWRCDQCGVRHATLACPS